MENKRLIFATGNEGKMKEIKMILSDLGYEILSLKDIEFEGNIEENGKTFEENAIIKAKAIMELTHEMVMADDSGLEIDFLNGEPGVHSARFMGENTPYTVKNNHIIHLLRNAKKEERTARFVSVIACAFPDGEVLTAEGVIEGTIAYEEKGENGFGYDSIFYVPEFQCTTAELSLDQKNQISHRGKALREMKKRLEERRSL